MIFIKKMCILRQVKQGFSGDGKTLSGLIKIEQYGKNLSVEVSVINFAPLSSGEYYCLIADEQERTELLPLRGKSFFNIVSELDLSGGFCGVVCFVKNEIVPIAYGVNGNKVYRWRSLVENAVPAAPSPDVAFTGTSAAFLWETTDEAQAEPQTETPPPKPKNYDDETVVTENYFDREEEYERFEHRQDQQNARLESGNPQTEQTTGNEAQTNVDAQNVRDAFEIDPDGYYLSVKAELDELFSKYPADDTLKEIYPHSEWVRVEEDGKCKYLVGVVYEELKAKYVCYAIPAADKDNPPEEIAEAAIFVPSSLFSDKDGFFILFQSTATGECIRPASL